MRYEQIKPLLDEAVLDEVKMSPSALQKFANSPEAEGMLMGIEFEMCVPNVAVDDDSGDGEYDYDMDERCYSIDDIIEFFRNGEMSNLGSSSAQRLREKMWDEYLDWTSDKIADNLDTDELNERVRNRLRDDIDWEDYVDDAREELGDEVPDDKVEERAKELAEEALDNEMSDASSRNYQYYYDEIRQEMEDEMREDADYDQEAWLRDIGVDYMSDAEREWSLDWPHWSYYGSDGEMDVESVGDEFGRSMGLEYVNTSNNYHGARRDGKNWIVEPDSSIDADSGDGGLEFVSPPMPIKDGLEMLQKMYKWAKDNGCYTNKSTGLHMNISVPDMTIEKLDYVKLALFMGDEHVLKQFGRQYNSYAKSAMSKIKDRIRPEDVPHVLAQMKQHLNSLASKTIHSGITDKYTSINTKDNYVEFRGPGGDYLDMNPFEVTNTVLRLAMSLRIATNPEAYKQEYAKKLYKLVEQDGDWTDPNNSVALFSRYALGEINKDELVSNVRQAQVARKEKKGEELQFWVMNKDGTGGKQLVFAQSETEAIIKGGKQMGMNREKSISTLKAEVKSAPIDLEGMSKEEYYRQVNDLPTYTLEQFVNEIKKRELSTLEKALDTVKNRSMSGDLSATNYEFLQAVIEREIARRSLPVDDGEMTQWRVHITQGPHAGVSTIINAPTPRNAKVAAQAIFRSQLNDAFIDYDYLEAREYTLASRLQVGTPEPANAQEIYDSLPNTYKAWLDGLEAGESSVIQTVIDSVANDTGANAQALNIEQRDLIISRAQAELRRRGQATQSSEEEMTRPWHVWLANIQDHTDDQLRNARHVMAVGRNEPGARGARLTDRQRQAIVDEIDDEFRRRLARSIERGEQARAAQQGDIIAPGLGEVDPLAAQQAELINRDDPVTSNDPEADSPLEVPGQGTQEFQIVNPHTGSIVAVIRQATLDHAVSKARQWEQDLGLSAGDLEVRQIGETNESINQLRKLAGIK